MEFKVFSSSEGNVWKYIFEKDDAIMETVLYQYESFYERTVICCSVMSGCPVGCKFCGTGAKYIRNLSSDEIVEQIDTVLRDKNIIYDINEKCKKLQFMFMSMGEPMLNWENVEKAIIELNNKYSNAQLLLSTIGVNDKDVLNKIIDLSQRIDKVGLQFSIHKSNNEDRTKLIPYENKMTLKEIKEYGTKWFKSVGRKPYLNYCIDGTNNTENDFKNLTELFEPECFNFTFSVVCSKCETMKDAGYRNLSAIEAFQDKFKNLGYNVRMFNPAGQDDIGGGCGQLWYVQKWLNERNTEGLYAESEWEDFIGEIYAEIIKKSNINDLNCVVEIAPGFKYKIANALKKLNYKGELYVIDPNKKAIEFLQEKYTEILPNARIYFLSKTLEEAIDYLPSNIDLLCANHCLDDMIINEYIKNDIEIFNDDNSEKIIEKWKELADSKELLNNVNKKILECFKNIFEKIKIKKIILAQYRSNGYFDENSKMIYDLTKELFYKIKELISVDDNIQTLLSNIQVNKNYKYIHLNDKDLYNNIQNENNWIVGGYKSE